MREAVPERKPDAATEGGMLRGGSRPTPEQQPDPVAAAPAPEPPAPSVTSTMLRWPTSSIPDAQENGQSDAGEPATTINPAWQPAEIPSESNLSVSLQNMNPEAIAAFEAFTATLRL